MLRTIRGCVRSVLGRSVLTATTQYRLKLGVGGCGGGGDGGDKFGQDRTC